MLEERVTVLWTLDTAPESFPADIGGTPIDVVRIERRALVPAVAKARAHGAVVAVVQEPSRAPDAFGLGVDEVLCAADLGSSARCDGAVRRAILRAKARDIRDRFLADADQVGSAAPLRLLGEAIAHEINNPLAVASLNCEALHDAIDPVLDVVDEVARFAARGQALSADQLCDLVAARALAPPSDEFRLIVEDIQAALGRAARIVGRITTLTALDDTSEEINLTDAVWEVVSFVQSDVERAAELSVEVTPDPCRVEIPRGWAMQIVSALLTNAVDAIDRQASRRGKLELNLLVQDAVALLEVSDNGAGMTPEVRRRALDPFFTTRRPGALGLGLTMAATYARRAGGELLIESEPGIGTSVQVFLPIASSGRPVPPPGTAN